MCQLLNNAVYTDTRDGARLVQIVVPEAVTPGQRESIYDALHDRHLSVRPLEGSDKLVQALVTGG